MIEGSVRSKPDRGQCKAHRDDTQNSISRCSAVLRDARLGEDVDEPVDIKFDALGIVEIEPVSRAEPDLIP